MTRAKAKKLAAKRAARLVRKAEAREAIDNS